MKNKIPYLTAIALVAWILAGCQKPPANESQSPSSPPSAPPSTNSNSSTNLSRANVPAVPGPGNTNNPASTRQ